MYYLILISLPNSSGHCDDPVVFSKFLLNNQHGFISYVFIFRSSDFWLLSLFWVGTTNFVLWPVQSLIKLNFVPKGPLISKCFMHL